MEGNGHHCSSSTAIRRRSRPASFGGRTCTTACRMARSSCGPGQHPITPQPYWGSQRRCIGSRTKYDHALSDMAAAPGQNRSRSSRAMAIPARGDSPGIVGMMWWGLSRGHEQARTRAGDLRPMTLSDTRHAGHSHTTDRSHTSRDPGGRHRAGDPLLRREHAPRRTELFRRVVRDDRGSVSAELVIATPLLSLLLLAIVQFALWSHAAHIAQVAAAQGLAAARAQNGTSASGTASARQVLDQLAAGPLRGPALAADLGVGAHQRDRDLGGAVPEPARARRGRRPGRALRAQRLRVHEF